RVAPGPDTPRRSLPHVVRHGDRPRAPRGQGGDAGRRGVGRVRGHGGAAVLVRVRGRRRARHPPPPPPPPVRPGRPDGRRRGWRPCTRAGPPDGEGGAGDGGARRRVAHAGRVARPPPGRGSRAGARGRVGGDHGFRTATARRRGPLPGRGLPPH